METAIGIQTANADDVAAQPSVKRRAEAKARLKKQPVQKAKKPIEKKSSPSGEKKRLARNAALREWRKKNKGRYAVYMAEWRAQRKGEQPTASGKRKTGGKARAVPSKGPGREVSR